jgi:hypothetical protein
VWIAPGHFPQRSKSNHHFMTQQSHYSTTALSRRGNLPSAPVRGIPQTSMKKIFDLLVRYFTAQTEERQRQDRMLPDAA